jgi:hypothetical protein
VLGQCTPSPEACRHTPAPSRAAPRRGFVPQAPTVQACVSGGARYKLASEVERVPAANRRPTTRTRRKYIAARANLPLYRQSRIYLLCPAEHLTSCTFPAAAASRRSPWRTATSTWPAQIFRDRTRPHPACFARCPKLERLEKQINSPVRDTRARATCSSLFPVPKLPHGVSSRGMSGATHVRWDTGGAEGTTEHFHQIRAFSTKLEHAF